MVLDSDSPESSLALPKWKTTDLNLVKDFTHKLSDIAQTGYGIYAKYKFFRVADGQIVGMISLYQHTADVISIGPEIFAPYRRRGYAKAALRYACEIAAEKGYRTVSQQIRTENTASIALHRSLGFETDGAAILNAKGNAVCIYQKDLL
jgi:RimJ/RimL family protein N-acetyltransferase